MIDTYTIGPDYKPAICTRCGADLDISDIVSGWCWRCGNAGVVELKEEER